jgi:aldose 1-epimerase
MTTTVSAMVAPSGDQYAIAAAGYRAVITESGAALRLLEHNGRPLLDGFAEDEMSYGGRGQLLMPWPNRIRDGAYSFDGRNLQLGLTEPGRHNASHGLARWAAWTLEEHSPNSVSLVYRLMAQTGYPWAVDLHVLYDLSADGLTVTQTATNLSGEPAPYACGAHPYLTVGTGPVDGWELTLPASRRVLVDDRLLPVDTEPVDGTDFDFRVSRPIRGLVFNDAFTDLGRGDDGRASVVLQGEGQGLVLWVDEKVGWLQVYTADDQPAFARRALAVEPMTAPADAFNSGDGLVTLASAGEPGDELSVSWGVRALS